MAALARRRARDMLAPLEVPSVRYIPRRGKSLAYQSYGIGPRALVVFLEIPAHLDLLWADPHYAEQVARLGENCRAVAFQQMGLGLSDRIDRVLTLEEQASDIAAVMDAEGISSAVLFGMLSTAMPVALLAAQAPERVEALVLHEPYAQGWRNDNFDRIAGLTAEEAESLSKTFDDALAHWGEGRLLDFWDPVLASRNRGMYPVLERCSATPAVAAAVGEAAATSDIRETLPLIRAPTRVLHHPMPKFPESLPRLVADLIPGATFHVLPPSESQMSLGESLAPVFDHLLEVVTGRPGGGGRDRQLATILFTDVVSSTELVAAHGDTRWGELLNHHRDHIRRHVDQKGGRVVEMIGDGSMSVFAGPVAAIHAGRSICDEARVLDIEVRAGVHTGECNRAPGGGMSGLAVHIAARVGSAAGPGEVWVSRTVRDLIGGSGLQMRSRGRQQLKGVSERWELFVVVGEDVAGASVPEEPSPMHATDRLLVATARRAPGLLRGLNRIDNARRRRSLHPRS